MKYLNAKTRTILAVAAIAISTGFAADARTRPPRYRYVELNAPGSRPHTTVPTGINNNNVVVGYYSGIVGCCYLTNGFSYDIQSGAWTTQIADPNEPFGTTMPLSINDSGTIVGEAISSQAAFGFTEQGGSFTDVNTCGANPPYSWVTGINNNLRTVGSCDISVAWFNDLFGAQTFTCPASGANTWPTAINNNDQVVGYSQFGSDSAYRGFVSVYGACQTTGIVYPGAPSLMLTGVNDNGTAIGWASYGSNNTDDGFALLYDISNGNMTPLTRPKLAVNGVNTGQINNSGWFVGIYYDAKGKTHGFYAEPVE